MSNKTCERCKKTFKYPYMLKKHLMRKYPCKRLEKNLPQLTSINLNLPQLTSINLRGQNKEFTVCEFCKESISKKNIRRHLRTKCIRIPEKEKEELIEKYNNHKNNKNKIIIFNKTVNNINSNNVTNITNNNIIVKINPFGQENTEFLEKEAPRLEQWLNQNRHGQMNYMSNHFDKRLDPRLLVPGAKSVVSLLLNYHSTQTQKDPEAPKISQYAFGEDYHGVIKKKLKDLMSFIHEEIGEVDGRVFVDSAPVMDKVWAEKSGLGWIGKNTNLISKKAGS